MGQREVKRHNVGYSNSLAVELIFIALCLVSTLRVSQFIAVRVDFKDQAEGVFDIDHSVGLLTRKDRFEALANM